MAQIKKTVVAFNGTPQQAEALKQKLEVTKKMKGGLMPSLQAAQEIYGYLPIEVQQVIAETLDVSLEEVFGVSTFYSQFTLNPQGKYQVSVCIGTACYVKGAGDVLDELAKELGISAGETSEDGKFSLNGTRCIGCCGLAPVMTINEHVYGKVTKADVSDLIKPFINGD